MFSKMVGEEVASLQINYDWLTLYSKKTINGLATKSADNSTCHVLLYNLIPSHVYSNLVNVQTNNTSYASQSNHGTVYLIDKTHSNFHVDWDPFSANFTYYPYSGQGGSRYDMAIGSLLQGQQQTSFYQWSWDHQGKYPLDQINSISFQPQTSNEINFQLNTNSVILFEFA